MISLDLLAKEAAQQWDGQIMRLISSRENAVFEMAMPLGRAALRLHRQGYQNDAAIRSELWWCAEMADLVVAVPKPIPANDGSLLVRLSTGRNASVIAWVEGVPLGRAGIGFDLPVEKITVLHQSLGRLIARIHTASDRLTLPPDFNRPRWDIEGLVGENPFWGRFWDHPAATAEQTETLVRARAYLRAQLTQLAADGGDFGPIHADVLRENVLVNDCSLSLIDFDDSGFGFRLYDLGTAMSQNLYEPAYREIRDALIAGYSETRPATVRQVEMFTLMRTCASVGWTAPRLAPQDPIHRSHIARAVMWADHVMANT